jgi:hypothetical protein
MKMSEIVPAGIPSFFQSDSGAVGIPSNRDMLSYLEYLMASSTSKISRKDAHASLMIVKQIESMHIPNSRNRKNLLQ